MHDHPRILTSLCLGATLLCSGCDDPDANSSTGSGPGDGIGDGETGGTEAGEADADAGDGDPAGDGDGDTGEPVECDGTSPYMGGWDIGCCQDEIVPNGWAPGGVQVGTIMPDWTLTDQFGEAVRLWDFCHDAIWFEYVALW
jgi:hypothetical protein